MDGMESSLSFAREKATWRLLNQVPYDCALFGPELLHNCKAHRVPSRCRERVLWLRQKFERGGLCEIQFAALSLKEAHLANPSSKLEYEYTGSDFCAVKFSADPGCSLVAELMRQLGFDGVVDGEL